MWKQSVMCLVRWKTRELLTFRRGKENSGARKMEALTRLVTESLARHGFDRPLDYRRLQWSRWFRCESPHSLLLVPSKPGVFAVAEEIADFSARVATDASSVPRSEASGPGMDSISNQNFRTPDAERPAPASRRMLAVTQFFEDDDMAFVLDRMLSRQNPMSARLITGRYFVRFVVIEDQSQRRSICNALNQWMANSAEKATGIGSHFATSLELTPATEYVPQPDDRQQNLFGDLTANQAGYENREGHEDREGHDFSRADNTLRKSPALAAEGIARSTASPTIAEKSGIASAAPHLDSGAASNIHCPSPLPSGF